MNNFTLAIPLYNEEKNLDNLFFLSKQNRTRREETPRTNIHRAQRAHPHDRKKADPPDKK